jgi:hypothetical protein
VVLRLAIAAVFVFFGASVEANIRSSRQSLTATVMTVRVAASHPAKSPSSRRWCRMVLAGSGIGG